MDFTDRLAIGQQSFEILRNDGAVYVDKTMYIPRVAMTAKKYMFLARPRRFGKSLFLSTLKCFFEGKRHLFKGLYIDSVDWDWEEYPVLHLDLNGKKYHDKGNLETVLNDRFTEWEKKYDIQTKSSDFDIRFKEIIQGVHLKTGKLVVILVDEYDKPLVDNINKRDNLEHYRSKMQSVYSNFKSCSDHIRLVFLTGVSRFSKLSIFSGLNNILDISFLDEYSEICGITEEELEKYFHDGIAEMAQNNGMTYDETVKELKLNYDGYRFSRNGSDIYNPWSLLSAFNAKEISNYWDITGIPTVVAEILRRDRIDLKPFLTQVRCSAKQLNGLTLDSVTPLALLMQAGYLTIKSYNPRQQRYTLGIPNREVKEGLMDVLMPMYADLKKMDAEAYIWKFVDMLDGGDADGFMKELQSYFAGITYELKMDDENNFQNAFFIFTSLLGLKVEAEAKTSDGRIDILIKTDEYIYVIELKYGVSAEAALRQIDVKEYSIPFQTDGRRIIEIGADFDPSTRRIGDWKIARMHMI